MASGVLLVQGTSIKISVAAATELAPSPTPTFATLDCIAREIQWQGGTSTENDTTTICSTAKEFRLGLSDSGTMSVSGHWKQGHSAHTVIRSADTDKQTRLIVVEFEDDPPGAVVAGSDAITDAQAGGAQSIDRNGDLVLGTDGARPSTLILYMMHRSKG